MFLLSVPFSQTKDLKGGVGGAEVHAILSPFLVLPPSVHDNLCFFFFCLFNRAFFLQCSHVTSMQSPYVLNSNVVSRRALQKPLRLTKTLQKRHSDKHTGTDPVMAISSDAHSCIQLTVTDT